MKPLIHEEPDGIDLELLRWGEVADVDHRACIERAAAGPLANLDAELAEFEAFWAAHRPPLRIPGRRPPSWWRPVLAVAAAVLAAIGISWFWPAGELGVRPMGALPVDLQATRGTVLLEAPFRLQADDELHVSFLAPSGGRVDVFTLQEDGALSVLARGLSVERAEVFSLYGAARLDDYEGREWLMVQLNKAPRSDGEFEAATQRLMPDPSTHASERLWVLEVTRWR